MKRASVLFPVALLLGPMAFSGCGANGGAGNPLVPTSHHMYLSLYSAGSIQVYTTPVMSSSTPAVTLAGLSGPRLMLVDGAGRLLVPIDPGGTGTTVDVFTPPLTSSSAPSFTLTTTDDGVKDVAEDSAGDVFVAESTSGTCCIDVFDGPVNSTRGAPSFTINANGVSPDGLGFPWGLAFDQNGTNLYVSSNASILEYKPSITSVSIPAENVTPNDNNYGVALDSTGRVFVANQSGNGIIGVYTQSFTTGESPAFSITVNAGEILYGLAFDSAGNLWAVDEIGGIWEIPEPISASSTVTKILTVTGAYGIAFGP